VSRRESTAGSLFEFVQIDGILSSKEERAGGEVSEKSSSVQTKDFTTTTGDCTVKYSPRWRD
jgi:hypothetical protein